MPNPVVHGEHEASGGGGRMWRWWIAVWHRLRPSRTQRSLLLMPMEETLHDVDGLALPRHGTVTIRDNHIWIRNPDDQGAWPTLVIPDDARLTVRIDGEKRIGEVVVQEGQRIEVELASIAPTIWFTTKVIRHNSDRFDPCHIRRNVSPSRDGRRPSSRAGT